MTSRCSVRNEKEYQCRHMLAAEAGQRGNQQLAASVGTVLGNRRFGIVQVEQDALAILQECFAFIGEDDFADGALQEFDAEAFF